MVVLLVGMAVTAVWMAAALPSWRQQAIREKEAELVFRGEAIARAIYLYRQKNGQASPPNLDVLISQRYLRKKYRDPIADKDFLLVAGVTAVPGGAGGRQGGGGVAGGGGATLQGGLIGVRSTSNEASIRTYNNQTTYSQWAFDFTLEQLRAGGGIATPNLPPGGRRGQGGSGEVAPIGPGGRGGQTPPGGRGQGGNGGVAQGRGNFPGAAPPPPSQPGLGGVRGR